MNRRQLCEENSTNLVQLNIDCQINEEHAAQVTARGILGLI